MANEGDMGNEAADLFLGLALDKAKRKEIEPFTGQCWNCFEPLKEGRFCPGGECRDDYTLRTRNRI